MPPHFVDLCLGDEIGWQYAGGVAGMNPGILDVLHDAANHAPGAVGDGVDIGFECVFQEAVDEYRMLRSDAHGPSEVAAERGVVIHDFHRPATENVGGPQQHWVADSAGYPKGF